MGMLDFLKVTVTEKVPNSKYSAFMTIAGKQSLVSNLGVSAATVSGMKLKAGQNVSFDMTLKEPKENFAFKGTGVVASVSKDEAKISMSGLSESNKQILARFLARSAINR
jgi:hypothetical protein